MSSTNIDGSSSVVSRVTLIRLMILAIKRAVPEKFKLEYTFCDSSSYSFDPEGDLRMCISLIPLRSVHIVQLGLGFLLSKQMGCTGFKGGVHTVQLRQHHQLLHSSL